MEHLRIGDIVSDGEICHKLFQNCKIAIKLVNQNQKNVFKDDYQAKV